MYFKYLEHMLNITILNTIPCSISILSVFIHWRDMKDSLYLRKYSVKGLLVSCAICRKALEWDKKNTIEFIMNMQLYPSESVSLESSQPLLLFLIHNSGIRSGWDFFCGNDRASWNCSSSSLILSSVFVSGTISVSSFVSSYKELEIKTLLNNDR